MHFRTTLKKCMYNYLLLHLVGTFNEITYHDNYDHKQNKYPHNF